MEKKNLGKNPGLWSGNIAEKKKKEFPEGINDQQCQMLLSICVPGCTQGQKLTVNLERWRVSNNDFIRMVRLKN